MITPEIHENAAIFHIHEGKPYGMADVDRTHMVRFDEPDILPHAPKKKPYMYATTTMFWVYELEHWVGFDFCSWQEKSFGPLEEEYTGPYLMFDQPPPTPEEIALAAHNKTTITRDIVRFAYERSF